MPSTGTWSEGRKSSQEQCPSRHTWQNLESEKCFGRIFSQIVEKREENKEEEFSANSLRAFDAFVDLSVSREPNSFQIFRVSV